MVYQIKVDRKKMRLKHPDELEAESKKLRDQSKLSVASTKPDLNFKPLKIGARDLESRNTSMGTFDQGLHLNALSTESRDRYRETK